MSEILLINASPHVNGSTDRAFNWALNEFKHAESVFLRQKKINPCIGCQTCSSRESFGRCIFESKDEVKLIFNSFFKAKYIVFFSPIYFYHLPSLFKGFIDRSQSFYIQSLGKKITSWKVAKVILLAGRPKGEKLFEGARLTLKYFLQPFGFKVELLGLRGVDGPQDLDLSKKQEILTFLNFK